MGDVMDSAGVPHFSGLRLDVLRLSTPTPSSPSSAKATSYSASSLRLPLLSCPLSSVRTYFYYLFYPFCRCCYC